MSQPGPSHFPETNHCSSGLNAFEKRQRPIQAKQPLQLMPGKMPGSPVSSKASSTQPRSCPNRRWLRGDSLSLESSGLDGNNFKRSLGFTQEQRWLSGSVGVLQKLRKELGSRERELVGYLGRLGCAPYL